jgi:predicted SnoaL-like aldol condensation-catalyzing enzyme
MKNVALVLSVSLAVACSRDSTGTGPSLSRNKALVRRAHAEVWSRGDLAAADEIYAADFVAHWLGGAETRGRDKFKALVAEGRRRAPDLNETVEQVVAEGDLVVTRFVSRGTFPSEPAEPSRFKEVTMHEMAIHRVVDGKIVEQWTVGGVPNVRHLDAASPEGSAGTPDLAPR